MPEAWCASCSGPCSPMIVVGWGMCRKCRDRPVYDFTTVNKEVASKKGRDWIKREIRKHLPKETE